MDKKQSRLRRATQTRKKIQELRTARLAVHRTNQHIYVQLISADGGKVLASASTVEKGSRTEMANGGNCAAATAIVYDVMCQRC